MKKSSILWSVLLVVFCALAIQHGFAFASVPVQFTPNWLTIIPTLAIFAAFVGLVIRKELAATKSRDGEELSSWSWKRPLEGIWRNA